MRRILRQKLYDMQIFIENFQKSFLRFVDIVLPPRCVITGAEVQAQGMVDPQAWAQLDFIDDPYCDVCGIPFEVKVHDNTQCAVCIKAAPPYISARSALVYNDASRSLILGFKHADKTHLVKTFTPWLCRAGAEMLARADVLIPVPLHSRRLMMRRYNQAALLVKDLSKNTGVTMCLDGLQRVRATQPQGRMVFKERQKNVRGAFTVPKKRHADIKGKTIVLLDDVYTTGATVKACTKTLLSFGAKSVHVLTLARALRTP